MRQYITGGRSAIFIVVGFCLVLNLLIWNHLKQQLLSEKEVAITAAVQRNDNLAVALEQYTIRTIQNADAILQLLNLEYQKQGNRIDFTQLNKQPFYKNVIYDGCAIIDTQGNLMASNIKVKPNTILNFKDRPYFKYHATQTADSLYVSKPLISRTIHKPVITLSRRITKQDGTFGGVIAIQISPSLFTLLYAGAHLRPNDIVSLVAPDGITYARRTGNRNSFGENISKSPLYRHLATDENGNYFAKDAIRQIPTYFSYRQLKQYPIIATVGTAESDVLADYQLSAARDYKRTTFISLLIILFSLLVGFFVSYRRKSMQLLKQSELKHRSIFENSRDAILLLHPDGTILDLNKATLAIFKIEEIERKPKHFTSLLSPEATATHQALSTESYHEDIAFTRMDGTSFVGEMASASYKDATGVEVIIAIVRDLTERKQMEKKLALEKKRRQRLITKHVIMGQEREREAIGQELHDNINQVLTSAKLYMEMAIKDPQHQQVLLPKCQQLIINSINDIRNLSHNLSAPTLGTRSLIDATNSLLETVANSTGIHVRYCYKTYKESIDKDIKLALFRILQEQVNNIIKHAQATEVQVVLMQDENSLQLSIKDNGKGFDTSVCRKGIGLNNIESRAKVFDGQVQIITAPGQGCKLHVSFPLAAAYKTKIQVVKEA